MADDGCRHSLQFDRFNVKIRASVECRTLGVLHWDCFATRRNKIVEISQGDYICGDPRAWGL
jgi:hypothetical protein